MEQLADIGEDALIKRLVAGLVASGESGAGLVLGPGDDCAVVDSGRPGWYQLLKTDALVEGVHYLADAPAEQVGWKAVARVVSDFAAMGGRPGQLLVTIAMPATQSVDYLEKLYQGMQRCAQAYGATISGGETSAVPAGSAAVISIAGTGWVEAGKELLRSAGRVGDAVYVTGQLGGSIKGWHLEFLPRVEEAAWLSEHFPIHAMMDLSDGLGRDLPRLAEASACGFLLHMNRLPCRVGCDADRALGDGEDYELLFTVAAEHESELERQWRLRFPGLELSKVGELVAPGEGMVPGRDGWQHFAAGSSSAE